MQARWCRDVVREPATPHTSRKRLGESVLVANWAAYNFQIERISHV